MSSFEVEIAGRRIGPAHPPFVVAEMSGNHNGSLERALRIVEAAADAGAQAVKLQTYTADTMTLDVDDPAFRIDEPNSPWRGQTLYELYQQASTPWEWHRAIFDRCRELGIVGFSTPFDTSAVDLLESLGAPAYKIASLESTHLPLIERVASTGKPVIISTGRTELPDIWGAVRAAREAGCRQLVLLKCTSDYPADPSDADLATIPHMRNLFDTEVGLSDHTLGIGVSIAAVALGASLVEKHFTLRRAEGGVDAAFSLEPEELRQLVAEARQAWQAVGHVRYALRDRERAGASYRRTLYVAEDMAAGDVFTERNLRAVRPGYGLPVRFYRELLGKRVDRSVRRGTPVSWDLIG